MTGTGANLFEFDDPNPLPRTGENLRRTALLPVRPRCESGMSGPGRGHLWLAADTGIVMFGPFGKRSERLRIGPLN